MAGLESGNGAAKDPGYYEDLIARVDTTLAQGEGAGVGEGYEASTGRVSLWEFISHNHSLLSICFAANGEVPPVQAGCGCCVDVGPLSRR